MGLFELTSAGTLTSIPFTTFVAEKVLERADLQRALREHIEVLGEDLLVVSEEFGDFQDARRRIDLLCVDRQARLVVVELKRTEDGGHMELQALRYAAMVSTMTFDQLVDIYERHLSRTEPAAAEDARGRLAEWLEDADGEDAVLDRQVRVLLASADFDRQITTTVLWLNDVYGLDIRCIRLRPYRVGERLLLDVQQIIPLPEAEELMVQLRKRVSIARAASEDGRDWTPYLVHTPTGSQGPLRKRWAVLALARALHDAGVSGAAMAVVLPRSRFLEVPGVLSGDELRQAFVAAYPKAQERLARWFLDQPLHDEDRTWVLSKMWGRNTVRALDALLTLSPGEGFGYDPA